MEIRILLCRALSIGAIAATLVGCSRGGSLPAAGQSAALPQTGANKVRGGYLYVSDIYSVYEPEGAVEVYSYDPKAMIASEVGKNTDFEYPHGECSDENGNVYVVDSDKFTVSEFSFGGTTVIKTLADSGGAPNGCSVDPTTDNLAVTNSYGFDSPANVMIYKNASGTPTEYSTGANYAWPAGYDPKGNLWVEGQNNVYSAAFVMELPKGADAFKAATFAHAIDSPGAIQWDGKYLDLLDQAYKGSIQVGLYRTKISGNTLTEVGAVVPATTCNGGTNFVQWASIAAQPDDLPKTQATQIIAGNTFCTGSAPIWDFPAGGSPAGSISGPNYAVGQTYVTRPKK